jgi:hypothetical protein
MFPGRWYEPRGDKLADGPQGASGSLRLADAGEAIAQFEDTLHSLIVCQNGYELVACARSQLIR